MNGNELPSRRMQNHCCRIGGHVQDYSVFQDISHPNPVGRPFEFSQRPGAVLAELASYPAKPFVEDCFIFSSFRPFETYTELFAALTP